MELTLVGSRTPYPLMKKASLINRSAIRIQRLKNQHFFPFKTNGRKCDFECSIHGIINSGKIEGAYFGSVRSIFLPKSNIMTFSEIKVKFIKKKKKNEFSFYYIQISKPILFNVARHGICGVLLWALGFFFFFFFFYHYSFVFSSPEPLGSRSAS